MARRSSLKVRVALRASLLVGLLWLGAVALTWVEARKEATELFDAHLVQAASLLVAQTNLQLEHDDDSGEMFEESHAPGLHRYGRRVAFQVWADRRLTLHSANAPSVPLSPVEEGLSDSLTAGERWRVYSAWNARRQVLVQVGERMSARDEITRAMAAGLLRPLLVALPLLALLIWFAVRQGMRPLDALAGAVEARSPDKLTALPDAGLPAEVLPLVERLNALFERVASTFEKERRFTADAAHELRTPLAGLRAQAQVARAAGDDASRLHALDQLIAGCDRMAHAVEQMLVLARVENVRPEDFTTADFVAVAREVVADLAPAALDREVAIELDAVETVPIRGNPVWLAMLLRNLVDNAARYSAEGGSVDVAIGCAGRAVVLTVRDNGPGVPAGELARLGQRFWRSPGTQRSGEGSGLGLSIVGRIVELHGGQLAFRNNPAEAGGGLTVEVRLPGVGESGER